MWKPTKNDVKTNETNDMTQVKRLDSEMVFMELVASMVEQNTIVIHDNETRSWTHKHSCSLLMVWLWIFTMCGCFFMANVPLICEDYTSDELFGMKQWKRLSQDSKLPQVEPQSMGTWTRLAALLSV